MTADFLTIPRMDWIGGLHDFHYWGSNLILSDGKRWSLWRDATKGFRPDTTGPGHKYLIGSYCSVMRWFNEAIERCPRLVAFGDTDSFNSARHFFRPLTPTETNQLGALAQPSRPSVAPALPPDLASQIGPLPRPGADAPCPPRPITPGVQWWIASDSSVAKISAVFFNTHGVTRALELRLPPGWERLRVERGEVLVADSVWEGFRERNPQPWRVAPLRQIAAANPMQVNLPAFSVARLELRR